jgi:transcriptional regulator with XRE-family HTH domain
MALSDAVRELRKHLGESQQAFSNRLGLSMATIVKYEAGREPTGKALAQLAHAAAEAGRHDLAYRFARALIDELGIERLRLGIWSAKPAYEVVVSDFQEPYVQHKVDPDAPGLMLVTFRGPEAQNYARSFFETFGRYLYGSPQEKEQAKALLEPFHQAAFRAWRGSK